MSLKVALDLHARKIQRAFLVNVAGKRRVRRWQAVAAIRLMGLGAAGEQMLAVDEDRHQDRMVGAVRIAEVNVVVQKRVALDEVRMEIAHRLAQKLRAENMDRQALGGSEHLVVAGDQRAGKIARHVEHRRAARAQ